MAGEVGAVAEIGTAVGGGARVAGGLEGGLGAAAIGTAVKAEAGLGAAFPRPEAGINLGVNVAPEATLATGLEGKLGAPEVGIKEIAGVRIPEANAPGVGAAATEAHPSAAPAQPEAGAQARNGTSPDTNVVGKTPAEGQKSLGEKPEEGAPKADQPPQAEGQDKAGKPAGEAEKTAPADKKEAKPPEDVAKVKRTQELEGKVKDRTATPDDIKKTARIKTRPRTTP